MSQRPAWQARYLQIADDIRGQIVGGQLAPGDQLPTEAELQRSYDVARGTVQKALNQLISEGLVLPDRPKGHFVRGIARLEWTASTDERHDLPADWWVAMVREQGMEPSQTIRVEVIRPAEAIASSLELKPTEFAVVRRRVWYINGRPSATYDSYYPEPIVRGTPLAQPDDIARGGRHVLAEMGHRMISHRDEITARSPQPDEATILQIPPGTPVIDHRRISWDENDIAIRCALSVLPGDRYTLTYSRTDQTP